MALAITFRLSFHDLKPRYLWAARSVIGNYSSSSHGGLPQQLRYSYLLSINLRQKVVLTPADIDPVAVAAVPPAAGGGGGGVTPMWVLYEGWEGLARGEVLRLPSDAPLAIPATPELNAFHAGHSLWCMAPMLEGGWALLGEPSKMVKVRSLQVSCALSHSDLRCICALKLA
eukprot:COSAG01_NODE_25169_length_753_cov_1.368502_1_plen_171_part_10